MFLIISGIVIILVWFYILFIRPWALENYPETFGPWQQLENTLWLNSRQILMARLYWIGGILVSLHEIAAAAGYDLTPILQQASEWVPERYRGLVIGLGVLLTGVGIEWLRRVTTQPLSDNLDRGPQQ